MHSNPQGRYHLESCRLDPDGGRIR